MLFSIIVPIYNVEEYLERCLKSIQIQACRDFEVIIIDDASTDGSIQIAREAEAKYDNMVVLEQAHAGQATARNKGIAVAKGEYIVFIDGDDYWEPGYLERLRLLIDQHSPDMCVASSYYLVQNGKKTKKTAISCKESPKIGNPTILFRDGKIPGAMWLVTCRKSLIMEHKITFSEDLLCNEDFDFIMKIVISAQRVTVYPEPFYNYFRDNVTSTYAGISGAKIYSYMIAYRRWFDFFSGHESDYDYSDNIRKAISCNYVWAYYQLADLPVCDNLFWKNVQLLRETRYILKYDGNHEDIMAFVLVEKIRRKFHRAGHRIKGVFRLQ